MLHEWEWYDGSTDSLFPMVDSTEFQDRPYFLHQANGEIYYADPSTYQDDGRALKVLVQTSRFDADTAHVKFCSRLEVLGDWESTTSNMTIYHSDDDYKTWSTGRTVNLADRAYLYRCGSFRRRAWRLYSESNNPMRLYAIELELDGGTH